MRLSLPFIGFVLAGPLSLLAQQPARSVAPPATGSVTGHVYCSDTRQPGRLAAVVLQPVVTPDVLPGAKASSVQVVRTPVVQTQMDGSFTIQNVAPGDYYAVAELPGYISPLSLFSREELNHPTQATADLMGQLLTPVTITANTGSKAEIVLTRGAVITGAVRFEDGTALTNSRVVLMRRDTKGKMNNYYPASQASTTLNTDDQGRFRFAGLPTGEYKLYAILAVQESRVPEGLTWRVGLTTTESSWLNVYYGNVFRRGDSKSINIAGAESSTGGDIEIQLSKLHSVSGTVLDATTGNPVNSATVQIIWSGDAQYKDDSQIGKTTVGPDGTFHFAFVPEGNYKLVISDAREVTHEQVPIQIVGLPTGTPLQVVGEPAPTWVPMRTFNKTAKAYGDVSQPLIVHSDVGSITVQVTVKPPAVAAQ
jgi:protocatechuate 3,4-dioxygenase beta subunit